MKLSPIIKLTLLCSLLPMLLESCRVGSITNSPQFPSLPSTLSGSTDTTSIGDLPVKEFFKDSVLLELIDLALNNNPDLHIAYQRIQILKEQYNVRRYNLYPTVNGSLSAGVERFGDHTMNGVGNFDTNLSSNISDDQRIPTPTPDYFIGFQSNWEIDLWGKLKNMRKAAYNRFLASEKGRHLMITSLVSEIAKLYFELLSLDSKISILQKNIKLQEDALEIIKIQKAAGKVTQLAVEQFTAQLLDTRSKEILLFQMTLEIENRLNFLIGRFPQSVPRGIKLEEQSFPESTATGIPSSLLLRRPDLVQAELELTAAKADVHAARLALFPTLTITPYLGLNSFNTAELLQPGSVAFGILSGLTVPIINRKRIKAGHSIALARQQEAFFRYQKAIFLSMSEVIIHMQGVENYNKLSLLKEEQSDVLENAVLTSNDLFLAGYASYLEVITAQKNVLDAELDLINVRRLKFIELINLYRALGGGWK